MKQLSFPFYLISLLLLGLLSLAPTNLTAQAPSSSRSAAGQKASSDDFTTTMAVMGSVLSNVRNFFVDTVDLTTLYDGALTYMLQQLDPYTVYFNEEETKAFEESTTGLYGGIGAILRQHQDSVVIIGSLMQGKAADKAGLRPADVIWRINGKDFSHTKVVDVRNELRGEPGTPITLVVRRPGYARDSLTVTFNRERIDLSPVSYAELLDGRVAFILLNTFSTSTCQEFLKAYDRLQKEAGGKLSGLILDLRDNGGGLMEQAIQLVNLFIPKGQPVVSLKGRYPQQSNSYKTTKEPLDTKIPLVVLINEGSASASEIVAGALQDYDRAVIVGRKSFGKGLVQGTLELPDGGLLKLTTARYYIPSGRSIQKLSYNHRGGAEQVNATDSLGTPYSTTGGRTVYAAGGIMPDIVCPSDSIPSLLGTLLFDTLTYDFVTDYLLTHKAPERSTLRSFDLGDEAYAAYQKKVIESGFTFKSIADELVKKVEEALKGEQRYDEVSDEFAAFQKSLRADTPRLMKTYEGFIRDYLNMEILSRYYYDEGRLEYYMSRDKVAQRAVSLLGDPTTYHQLLKGK